MSIGDEKFSVQFNSTSSQSHPNLNSCHWRTSHHRSGSTTLCEPYRGSWSRGPIQQLLATWQRRFIGTKHSTLRRLQHQSSSNRTHCTVLLSVHHWAVHEINSNNTNIAFIARWNRPVTMAQCCSCNSVRFYRHCQRAADVWKWKSFNLYSDNAAISKRTVTTFSLRWTRHFIQVNKHRPKREIVSNHVTRMRTLTSEFSHAWSYDSNVAGESHRKSGYCIAELLAELGDGQGPARV